MGNPPIYGQVQASQASFNNPEPVNPPDPAGPSLEQQVEALVAARLSDVEAKYAARVKVLEEQLEAAKAVGPTHLVPEHAGGPGYDLAQTWSQWHQELARRGELTPEILTAAGVSNRG